LLLLSYVGVMPRYGDTRASPHRPLNRTGIVGERIR